MYVAKHFEIPDDHLAELLGRVRAGNLVTVHDSGPQATFVPFHLETRGTGQVLVTHLMRINPQAVEPVTGPALVIIDVDDAYVPPAWYATNKDLPNVPTWDYITIHVTGEVRFTADPGAALEAARELTSRMEPPEVLEAVGEEKLRKMARAIVRAEVAVEKIQEPPSRRRQQPAGPPGTRWRDGACEVSEGGRTPPRHRTLRNDPRPADGPAPAHQRRRTEVATSGRNPLPRHWLSRPRTPTAAD